MKKGQIGIGIVQKVDFPNKGLVQVTAVVDRDTQTETPVEDGEIVTVKNTIPGQVVRFGVNKVRHKKAEARLLEIVERSPLEEESRCPHFEVCGGCTYQTLPYEEQVKIKESQVRKILSEVVAEGDWFEGIKKSPLSLEYRNKMEFSFGDEYKDGPLALGMHKRGSFYDIVTVEDCCLVHGDFRLILRETLAFFRETGLTYYHKLRHEGYLRHLLVRRGVKTGEILIDLVTSTQYPEGGVSCTYGEGISEEDLLKMWSDRISKLSFEGRLVGILHTLNDSLADVVQSDRTDLLCKEGFFYEELLGLKFKITPFSFFQTNSLGAQVLYETARDYALSVMKQPSDVGDGLQKPVIFDLYSGTGTIGQMMAPVAKKVIGVEIVEEAVEAAHENTAMNGLHNCNFLAGDVLKVLGDLTALEDRPDLIILDPPRDGIHPKALPKIIAYGCDHLVYISCKVTSLARDLVLFQDGGYRVERAVAVDMFPGTGHVETVVLMTRTK